MNAGMRLGAYLTLKGMTAKEFGVALGCSTKAVKYWITGERFPSHPMQERISSMTEGAVMPNDHVETRREFLGKAGRK